jgi:hypothetical protein
MNNKAVAWMNPETLECGHGGNVDWEDTGCIPLYTHPSEHDLGIADAIGFDRGYKAATVKELTAEEIEEVINQFDLNDGHDSPFYPFARAILRKAQENG